MPPGTAAVSLNMVQTGCQVFMCPPGTDCAQHGMAYGPIEQGACNIGAIMVTPLQNGTRLWS